MSDDMLTVVSCTLPADAVDPLFELLDADDFVPTSWFDVETRICRLDVFLEDHTRAPHVIDTLSRAVALIGISLQPTLGTIATSDWAESWKRFFHTEKISEHLVVRPSWETYAPTPEERVIILDPGMSFGTGKHATTQGCLKFLDRLATENTHRSVVDMGCGTGILAIGARLLGFEKVYGFDNDPECMHVAEENAAINHADVDFYVDDLAQPQAEPADIVVANILAPILIRFAPSVAGSLADTPDARLIVSGILVTQYADVKAAYAAQGLREVDAITLGEWTTGLFAR